MNQDCCSPTSQEPASRPLADRYDIAVIGAGSAGFSAAITAAESGAKVLLVGYGTIGGTCVNVGCVPSKAMIRAAEVIHHSKAGQRFAGISTKAEITDWGALSAQKDQLVDQLRQAKYTDLLPAYDHVTYVGAQARLSDDGVVVDGRRIKAAKVIIATGTSAVAPDLPGLDEVTFLTSTEALDLKTLPTSLVVMGAGYIGCELAQMFARVGVRVRMVCRSRLLPDAEPEISTALTGYFRDEGIVVDDGLVYQRVENTADGVVVHATKDGHDLAIGGQQLLITAGRRPNTANLGLEECGVDLLPGAGIRVDAHMRTTRAGVYAAGDVTGTDQFVYMAAYGAKLAAKNALGDDSLVYDNSAMPWVVFSDPQVAGVGVSEAAAKAQGFDVKTSVLDLRHVPRALAARDTRGLIKLVADQATNKIIGAQIMAPEGADSIQTAVMAVKFGLTVSDLADTIFPYLTTVEGLKLAAQTFDKDVSKLSCCAG